MAIAAPNTTKKTPKGEPKSEVKAEAAPSEKKAKVPPKKDAPVAKAVEAKKPAKETPPAKKVEESKPAEPVARGSKPKIPPKKKEVFTSIRDKAAKILGSTEKNPQQKPTVRVTFESITEKKVPPPRQPVSAVTPVRTMPSSGTRVTLETVLKKPASTPSTDKFKYR